MYFTRFPAYQTKIDGKGVSIEDIFTRVSVGKTYSEVSSILIPYLVKNEDKIEDVAQKYYGSAFYHWIIILINNMTDPRNEWPLSEKNLYEKIFDIYDYSVTVSTTENFNINDIVTSNVNAQFKVTSKTDNILNLRFISGSTNLITNTLLKKKNTNLSTSIVSVTDPSEQIHHYEEVATGYQVFYDETLLTNIPNTNSQTSFQNRITQDEIIPVTNLDFEQKNNDAKRTIRLLNKQYLQQFIQNFESELGK